MKLIPSLAKIGHPAKTYTVRHTDSRLAQKLSCTKTERKNEEREGEDDINEGSKKTGEMKQEREGKKRYTRRTGMNTINMNNSTT
jgi:hypothetical protein